MDDGMEELLKPSGIEIVPDESVKAVLLYAVPNCSSLFRSRWLILVEHVEKAQLYRHISYNIDTGDWYFGMTLWYDGYSKRWGTSEGYTFFYATNEQRKFVVNKLSKDGYKFVKPLNKLLKR